ncbi:DUF559 domain-containing protein [Gaetbulibacter sp. PBL-D1]|uniref:DUF559 domain-containing protein n=1 Tax=Gaetbulibacter sp. PBL-D1 TaxID=3422594 RepID=UPI003D2ED8E9
MGNDTLKSRVIKTEHTCKVCNTIFKAYAKENRKFCSKQCWKSSKKGVAFIQKNGKNVNCKQCNKQFYKPKSQINRSKNHFCSTQCQIDYQGRNKLSFECKMCGIEFRRSKSEVEKSAKRGHKILYCSIICRNNDTKRMKQKSHKANKIKFKKYGLNSFEKKGRKWLISLGFKLDLDFKEQVLLFDTVSVDVFFEKHQAVVQFDGEYWHTKPERKAIDIKQDSFLKSKGLKVLRISDTQVKESGFNFFDKQLISIING